MSTKKHLDLGCGKRPRNPFLCPEVHGIDVYAPMAGSEVTPNYKSANLVLEPIPHPDNTFDSISAFDFIEHIPRLLPDGSGGTRFPFIELMSEVWRVLKPGGVFYAVTPAYPRAEAFQDPTHVNIITDKTHDYFCRDFAYTKNYGFSGQFKCLEARWVFPRLALTAEPSLKKRYRSFVRTCFKGQTKTHFLWQLEAVK